MISSIWVLPVWKVWWPFPVFLMWKSLSAFHLHAKYSLSLWQLIWQNRTQAGCFFKQKNLPDDGAAVNFCGFELRKGPHTWEEFGNVHLLTIVFDCFYVTTPCGWQDVKKSNHKLNAPLSLLCPASKSPPGCSAQPSMNSTCLRKKGACMDVGKQGMHWSGMHKDFEIFRSACACMCWNHEVLLRVKE